MVFLKLNVRSVAFVSDILSNSQDTQHLLCQVEYGIYPTFSATLCTLTIQSTTAKTSPLVSSKVKILKPLQTYCTNLLERGGLFEIVFISKNNEFVSYDIFKPPP